MRRIMLLSTGLGLGGAESQVVFLAAQLRARDWQVRVVTMLPPDTRWEALESRAVPVVSLDMRRGVPSPRALLRLAGEIRRFRPHILHCHMIHANLLGRIARLLAPVPALVSTAHSIDEGSGWRDWAYRLTDRLSEVTTNVCRAGLERYVQDGLVNRAGALWIPNGIDTDRFRPDAGARHELRSHQNWNGRFVWLAVGNIREPKDYPTMLRAFRSASRGEPRTTLAIAGVGALDEQIRAMAAEMGLADRVEFLGRRTDVVNLLRAADAYVMSSRWEGTPIALLEAAASELPIAATNVGGNPEVITDRLSGLLAPPGNPDALATAMIAIQNMPADERSAMGQAARTGVLRRYSADVIVSRWENTYRRLIESATPQRKEGSLEQPTSVG